MEKQQGRLMDASTIQERIADIRKLPACPKIIPRALQLARNPYSSLADYERLISQDPALAAEILKSVNSPFYWLRNRIGNLKTALSLIGLDEIFRILLNASFHKALHNAFDRLSYNFELFWRHSQMTANLSALLADRFLPGKSGEAFLGGLLHDLGIPIIEQYFCEEWSDILLLCEEGQPYLAAEREVMGLSHGDLAAELFRHWNIPEEISLPVRFHHQPLQAPAQQELCKIVFLADQTAATLIKDGHENVTQEPAERDAAWQQLLSAEQQYQCLEDQSFLDEIRPVIEHRIPERV